LCWKIQKTKKNKVYCEIFKYQKIKENRNQKNFEKNEGETKKILYICASIQKRSQEALPKATHLTDLTKNRT
jgi:hypothetical protein